MVGRASDGDISFNSVAITTRSSNAGSNGSLTDRSSKRMLRAHHRSWWGRRSPAQRAMLIVLFAVIIFALGFGAAVGLYEILLRLPRFKHIIENDQWRASESQNGSSLNDAQLYGSFGISHNAQSSLSRDAEAVNSAACTSPACVSAAFRLLNSIDTTADPCDDFYQYACGKWVDSHVIPEDKAQYGRFEEMAEQLEISIKRILEDEKPTGIPAVQKAKNVYKACLNKALIAKAGIQPALEFMKSVHPWPVIQPELFNESMYDIVQALGNTSRLGEALLISVSIGPDSKNPTRRVLQIDQTSLGMPSRDYLLRAMNDTSVQAYYEFMTSIAVILDLQTPRPIAVHAASVVTSRAQIERDLLDMLNFEIQLANITTPKEMRRDPMKMYNNMTIAQLTQLVPEFDWLRFLRAFMQDSGVVINSNETIIVGEVEYLQRLMLLLEQTPTKILANYIGWRNIAGHISDLDDSFKETRLRFKAKLMGVTSDPPRWKPCVSVTMDVFDMGIGRLYIENYFDKKSKNLAEDLINRVNEAFSQHLDEIDWINDEERKLSREKAAAMIRQIGYSDQLMNDTWLNAYHAENVGNETDHFGNMIRNARAGVKVWQKKLREPIDRNAWEMQPANINAFYNPSVNSIMFLAGILQAPYFDRDQPMSLNFGSIGVIMGHEITHGFDDEGRRFDKNGLLQDWWSPETTAKYLNKTQCVIDMYNNYTIDSIGMNLNGINTQGENIADMGGVRQAYRAYSNWRLTRSRQEEQPRLPGLPDLTHDQLFFLAGATAWCGIERPEKLKQLILTDTHSPEKYRIIGPFSVMPEFSRAFNCSINSRMNRANQCRVW